MVICFAKENFWEKKLEDLDIFYVFGIWETYSFLVGFKEMTLEK